MAGVVLETLSTRKLSVVLVILLLLQVTCYLIGGLAAPRPYFTEDVLSRMCKQPDLNSWAWFKNPYPTANCPLEIKKIRYNEGWYSANQIVFVFQYPKMREDVVLDYSRWHQSMIGLLTPIIEYEKDNPLGPDPVLTLDVRLGSRDKDQQNWTEVARSLESRPLHCTLEEKIDGEQYDCEPFHLFELGSVHHDFYLVNIRLPGFDPSQDNITNQNIGAIKEFHFVAISQSGGFTKVWMSLKTVFFPIVLAAVIWYWRRVTQLARRPNLLEKTLFALAVAMSFLNLPVEFLTLQLYMPYMILFGDVRQGCFYSFLLCFWVIFAGEHMMDDQERNSLKVYWQQLSGVILSCICLFVFEICERGVQLYNPFYSIWSGQNSARLAYTFLVISAIAACVYFLLFLVMVIKVFMNVQKKKANLEHMSKARRKFYKGAIFRFQFLMVTTLFCAAMTVVFFILSNFAEVQWRMEHDVSLEHSSAFLTGVYGMWNLYIILLMILYAPSHKQYTGRPPYQDESEDENETIEFTASVDTVSSPNEGSGLTSFTQKAAAE